MSVYQSDCTALSPSRNPTWAGRCPCIVVPDVDVIEPEDEKCPLTTSRSS